MGLRQFIWPFRSGITRRLAIINIVALLPMLVLCVMLTQALMRAINDNQAQAALGLTIRAADGEIRLISAAQVLARTLSETPIEVLKNPELCRTVIDAVARAQQEFSLIGYIAEDGQMRCASQGRVFDFTGTELLSNMNKTPGLTTQLERFGPVSGVPILSISHPVLQPDGTRDGVITVSVPQHVLRSDQPIHLEKDVSPALPDALLTFDKDGQLLTSSVEVSDALTLLPRDHSLADLTRIGTASFVGEDHNGDKHSYAVVPLTSDLHLIGVWQNDLRASPLSLRASPYLVFVLTVVIGFIAASLAADRLVIRHMRSLVRSMTEFSGGVRHKYLTVLQDPPDEIAILVEAYDKLTGTIQHEEALLENLLREKEYLLREVHHRTGNSMQLIASILRMHSRETTDPDQRAVYDQLYGRVMILSTVHLSLYRSSGIGQLDMQRLITDVISRIDMLNGGNSGERAASAEIAPLSLSPQQAVPLALLLSELLPAFYAEQKAGSEPIQLTLFETGDGQATLAVTGSLDALARLNGTDGSVPSHIGARLLRNFVRQLDAVMELTPTNDHRLTFTINFVMRLPVSEIGE